MSRKVMKLLTVLVCALLIATMVAGCGGAKKSEPAPGAGQQQAQQAPSGKKFVIGWSTIYLTPSWMQETLQMMNERVKKYQDEGVVDKMIVANANGDTTQQIAQIQGMIDQKVDAIIVDAGSATALNAVLEKAVQAGIPVINFDSLVSTDKITAKINTNQFKYGEMLAQWLVDKLGGKGKIITFNGPAGVAVSNDRLAGAQSVLKKYPDIKVVANLHSEYNIGPAKEKISSALAANKDVNGILSLGGSLSAASVQALREAKMKMIPVTGENYNGFLKMWAEEKANGLSSLSTAQPNWLGTLAVEAAVRVLQGYKIAPNIEVPLPRIDDSNLSQFVANDKPDDYYPIQPITEDQINQILGAKTK